MTGYTQALVDNNLDFPTFALTCARAFGVCISLRDESLDVLPPEKIEENSYYLEQLKKTNEKFRLLNAMSKKEALEWSRNEIARQIANLKKVKEEVLAKDEIGKCRAMVEKVEAWEPPTEEHIGLKTFMLQQLSESIRYASSSTSYYDEGIEKLEKTNPDKFFQEEIEDVAKDLTRYGKEWEKELLRTQESNNWLKSLRDSLKSE
jgi:poly-D-alanine transfer protein DltD